MGQGESKINGSTTFAYLVNPRKQQRTSTPKKDYFESDPVLSQPDFYGLKTHYSLPTRSSSYASASLSSIESVTSFKRYRERPDSGYMSSSYHENIQLTKDLIYIDRTYYPTRSPPTILSETNNEEQDPESSKHNIELSMTDAMFASPDKSFEEVYLSCRSIFRLSPNIGMLTMIKRLDLSNNHLTELPESIGHLQNLESLSLSRNKLTILPDTICYLTNLIELDVSFNEVGQITPYIGYLEKLKTLSLAFNKITKLPTEMRGLVNLISLDLSRNPLRVLSAEISKLPFLRRIRLEDCPFDHDMTYPLKHDPPSLTELCARTVIKNKMDISKYKSLPDHLVNYINSAKSCSSCLGPYIESFVLRGQLMEKVDIHIPLEYTLCSAHWSDADDRILNMFSTQPENTSDNILLPLKPILPASSEHSTEKESLKTRRSPPMAYQNLESVSVDTSIPGANLVLNSKISNDYNFCKSSLSRIRSKLKRQNIPW